MKNLSARRMFCILISVLACQISAMPVDQCNSTAQCRMIFGPSATDCRNSRAEDSVCMCGTIACAQPRFTSPSVFAAGSAFQIVVEPAVREGVDSVELFVDSQTLRTERAFPYQWGGANASDSRRLRSLAVGQHSLRAVVRYTDGRQMEANQQLSLTGGQATPTSAPTPTLTPTPTPTPTRSPTTPISGDFTRWSEKFGGVGPNQRVVIGADERILLDRSADVGSIVVDGGELIVQDGRDITLSTDWLLVLDGGLFLVGTKEDLHESNFTLVLTGDNPGRDTNIRSYLDRVVPGMNTTIENNDAFLMAMGGISTIEMHSADAAKETWSQLDATADRGDTVLQLNEATGWEVGDRIAIATTDYDMKQTEERSIVEVRNNGRTMVVDRPLNYMHYGEVETYNNGKSGAAFREWDLDMRAEVALLTRNVTITGDENADQDRFGGHTMVMHGGEMYISGVQFTKMGQEGILGRYPLHWHMLGDIEGQYVESSSIHNTYNKGLTMHGVQNGRVSNNAIYNTIGHGYFFEDGSETGMVLDGNLGMNANNARPGKAAHVTDLGFASNFWIENPDNYLTNNHAAGSLGAGFWLAVFGEVGGLSASDPRFRNINPSRSKLGAFGGNSAHSVNTGFSTRQNFRETPGRGRALEWKPSEILPEISGFTSYMTTEWAVFGSTRPYLLSDSVLAESSKSIQMRNGQVLENVLFVGDTDNVGNPDTAQERLRGHSLPDGRTGVIGATLYDGPTSLYNVHFENFTESDSDAIDILRTAWQIDSHIVNGISFGYGIDRDNMLKEIERLDGLIHDIDGSLTGVRNSAIVGRTDDFADIVRTPDATFVREWSAYVIPNGDRIGQLHVTHGANITITRSDGASGRGDTSGRSFDTSGRPWFYFPAVINGGYTYTIQVNSFAPGENSFNLSTDHLREGQFMMVEIRKNNGIRLSNGGFSRVGSMNALRRANRTSVYETGAAYFVKLVADQNNRNGGPRTHDTRTLRDPSGRSLDQNYSSNILKFGR